MLSHRFHSKTMGLMLAALLMFLPFSNVVAQQQDKLIEAIDFQGNRRLTDEELLQHIKIRSGERFDETQVQEDLQSLLKLGLFSTPQTKVLTEVGVRGGVNVIFEIRELPLIVKLDFKGMYYVPKKDILAELLQQQVAVEVGTPYNPVKLQNARRMISEYLSKRGYADAKVEIWMEEQSATTLILTFVIDELPDVDEGNFCEDSASSNK